VVHLGKYYPPSAGGIETHTQTLARAQADLGADVRVLVVNHAASDGRDATFEQFTRTTDVEESDGSVRVVRVGRWANLAKFDISPGLGATLRRLAVDPPDVWHLHTPNVTMMLAVLAKPWVRPLVITHHSDIIRQRLTRYLFRPVERAVYGRAARILPTSPAYVVGSSLLGRYEDRVTPVPLGIDLEPFRSPSAAALRHADIFRERHGCRLWLSVGRLIYYKGLHVGLAALRDVPGTLLVIGTGPLEAELRQHARELGVADRVVWHRSATQDELIGAYHAATALWFPSIARSEAFGLVQVEAMATGCPVINTAIPASAVPWVCRHEQEGLTAAVADPDDFARAAKRLLSEPGLRERLATEGRERAKSFDWRIMAAQTLDVYMSVAERIRCASFT
jgi:rhamnosyl/mannosyltransferase